MPKIRKMPPILKRPILVMNGKIYRHWEGNIPRKTTLSPIPDGMESVLQSSPDGTAVITIDTKLSVMKPGSRHVMRFWFRGNQVKMKPSKSGKRLVVCIDGPYQGIEPLTIRV